MTAAGSTASAPAAIRAVGVAGAGVMGVGIAQIVAQAGIDVTLLDNRAGAAQAGRDRLSSTFQWLAGKNKMTAAAAQVAANRIHVADGIDKLADCDLVIEAIIEDAGAKQALLRAIESVVSPQAVLASNTSSLSITAIGAALEHPERFAGLHFFNPVPLMKVVEVIGGILTDDSICQRLEALAQQLGFTPIRASDTPGFVINHGGRGYGSEALRIAAEGIADYATIDRILRGACGFRMGPFELFDLTGLDVSHPVMESIYAQYYHEPRFRPSPITRQRLAGGLLGRKSGRGFYRHDGSPQQAVPAAALPDRPARVFVADVATPTGRSAAALVERLGATRTDHGGDDGTLCVVAPIGDDASACCVTHSLDPSRTVAIDMLFGIDSHRTLMATPVTTAAMRRAALGLFTADGVAADLVEDSPGFIAQRTLAVIVSIASEMAQQRVAMPQDIDRALMLGLGYPKGPLAWGDAIGASTVLQILEGMQRCYGDPRYRPSPWHRRRASLGLSLLSEPPQAG